KQVDDPQHSQVFTMRYANASDTAPIIQNVLASIQPTGRGAQPNQSNPFMQRMQMIARATGGASNAYGNVVADMRTNSLVITATDDNLKVAGNVIKELDKPVQFASNAYVVTLANARADLVAQTLNQAFATKGGNINSLLNPSTGTNSSTGRTTTNLGAQLTSGTGAGAAGAPGALRSVRAPIHPEIPGDPASQLAAAQAQAAETGSAVAPPNTRAPQFFPGGGGPFRFGGPFGGGAFGGQNSNQTQTHPMGLNSAGQVVNIRDLSGGLIAIPDTSTNSVVIVTAPENREVVAKILDQLDRVPEQVMIETLVVEASLDSAHKLGVEWNFTSGKSQASFSSGLFGDTSQPQGLRYTLTGGQYGAFLQLLQTDTRFQVLSTPRIFTSNNSTAEINISQSLPYVLSSIQNVTGTLNYNYAFLDVGIVLAVTPRISANGYVTMDVTQTANDFVAYTSFNAPIVNQREADTTVSVKDGQTVVLGGIIKNTVTSTVNKIPILGDLPIIGNLFRTTNKENNKTELLVFLTPHIVRDAAEADALRKKTQGELDPDAQRILKSAREQMGLSDGPPAASQQKPATGQSKSQAPIPAKLGGQ
ncbi:MAG TPA: secretin N-terminal domain-containing protein, partial [Chthonomonadales bacterium]|nr:secretin N-terminal domain-containing protein [Chthonomonadales bacterium]